MNFCTLQDAYGVKTFKSPKVAKLGQKGKGLRGIHDTPEKPPQADVIGAPAGGCEDQEDILITKARQETPIIQTNAKTPDPTVAIEPVVQRVQLQPLFDFNAVNLDRMDLGLVVFALGAILLVTFSKK